MSQGNGKRKLIDSKTVEELAYEAGAESFTCPRGCPGGEPCGLSEQIRSLVASGDILIAYTLATLHRAMRLGTTEHLAAASYTFNHCGPNQGGMWESIVDGPAGGFALSTGGMGKDQ
jgi:hypothetical protein